MTFLDNYTTRCDNYRNNILAKVNAYDPVSGPVKDPGFGEELKQGEVFRKDLRRHTYTLAMNTQYEALSLAEHISTIALAPFALFIDLYRLCVTKTINASTVLKNLVVVPKHIILSLLFIGITAGRITYKITEAISIGIGHFVWHGGERLVRHFKPENKNTVLSDKKQFRDIVYSSIGVTVLAAALLSVPVLPVQLLALPIILGSVYAIINNQFTTRECPEYYTMGHYYDGKNLRGHAARTNNPTVKSIVTGCYASTGVTRIAGVVLACVGTIPFAPVALPITIAGAMVGTCLVIGLVAGHILSNRHRNKIRNSLEEYGKLIGMEWTEERKNKTWDELIKDRIDCMDKKLASLEGSHADFYKKFHKLENYIYSQHPKYMDAKIPIRYLSGWHANNTRNSIGYLSAGLGTLGIIITTVCLRVLVL